MVSNAREALADKAAEAGGLVGGLVESQAEAVEADLELLESKGELQDIDVGHAGRVERNRAIRNHRASG